MDAKEYFNGKKITLMGLGLLGRGVGDVKFLASVGAELIVTDLKTEEQLESSFEQLRSFPHITFHLGEHRLEDFHGRDLIIKAAGVPLNSPYIAEAKKHKIPVRMSADLFAELAGIPVVGITGTRGKSTVTHLISHILKNIGMDVLVGGNVRGVSSLALLPEVTPESVAVLELDSWQLQGFGEAHISPQVAVFTTFLPDHMNYYRNAASTDDEAMRLYFADKSNIFLNQDESDTLVLGEQVAPFVQEYGYQKKIRANTILAGAKNLPKGTKLQILGEHNRYNAGLATEAARALGVDDETIRLALESFAGLPGRLEFLRDVKGVKIYNDNNSTTPDATLAALKALDPDKKKNVVLIVGGDDKKLDMSALVAAFPEHCSKIILFKERGTDRIRDEVFELTNQGVEVYEEEGLKACIERAVAVAKPGESILYSPAFSSFGKYFKNEYDRNDQFVKLINELK